LRPVRLQAGYRGSAGPSHEPKSRRDPLIASHSGAFQANSRHPCGNARFLPASLRLRDSTLARILAAADSTLARILAAAGLGLPLLQIVAQRLGETGLTGAGLFRLGGAVGTLAARGAGIEAGS